MDMSRSVRTVELDPELSRWLAQLDEDPDELVEDLLSKYREESS